LARFSGSWRSNGAGSTTLPLGSLYAPAGNRLILREVHAFNTTDTAVAIHLRAFTATGTQGSGQTEIEYDNTGPTPTGTLFDTHTVTPTITAGAYASATLAAATGAGVIWEFGDAGIYIPAGTGNGAGVLIATGTGQILDLTFVWDE
jgi:hypothetical protein